LAGVGSTTFANVDLSGVKGLETLSHVGPSFIGIDTIYRSKGKIPLVFLRGAGVPDDFIKNMKFMNFTRNGFYSLFISHSSQDKEFADYLYNDLQNNGVRCWLDSENMRGGEKLEEQIDKAIRKHERMLLILSLASMASEWVKTEIAKARKLEVEENRKVLFPIRLCAIETIKDWKCFDSDIGKDSAREIRDYCIPNFSNWKDHDAYKKAFNKLLDDLHGKPELPSA
jgi:hypothetical protein